jgi:hypothetical protein
MAAKHSASPMGVVSCCTSIHRSELTSLCACGGGIYEQWRAGAVAGGQINTDRSVDSPQPVAEKTHAHTARIYLSLATFLLRSPYTHGSWHAEISLAIY